MLQINYFYSTATMNFECYEREMKYSEDESLR
jgi:hypothetical protein